MTKSSKKVENFDVSLSSRKLAGQPITEIVRLAVDRDTRSLTDIANACRLSVPTISRVYEGKGFEGLHARTAKKIATGLGYDLKTEGFHVMLKKAGKIRRVGKLSEVEKSRIKKAILAVLEAELNRL